MNGYKQVYDFLESLRNKIGNGATVSYSVGPNGPGMLISFHESEDLQTVKAVEVDFDQEDFSDEERTTNQIVTYLNEYVSEIVKEKEAEG